jgi:hypothetical protein
VGESEGIVDIDVVVARSTGQWTGGTRRSTTSDPRDAYARTRRTFTARTEAVDTKAV